MSNTFTLEIIFLRLLNIFLQLVNNPKMSLFCCTFVTFTALDYVQTIIFIQQYIKHIYFQLYTFEADFPINHC